MAMLRTGVVSVAAWLVVLGAVAAGVEAKGGVVRARPTAMRHGYPAGAALAAGVTAYKVGQRMYTHNVRYDSDNFTEYYNRQSAEWRSKHPRRSATGCPDARAKEPRVADTTAWLTAQIIFDMPPQNVSTVELEVDLYEEIAFRVPCRPPTDSVVLAVCAYAYPIDAKRTIRSEEQRDPRICTLQADFDSSNPHSAARRRLLAEDDVRKYAVVDVALGAIDAYNANHLAAAVVEMTQDDNSHAKAHYSMVRLEPSSIILVAGAGGPSVSLTVLAAALLSALV